MSRSRSWPWRCQQSRQRSRSRRFQPTTISDRPEPYAFRWYPDEPAIDHWLALYREIARRNAGEPDAGRFLLAWAQAAGFDEVRLGASVWCFATPDDRAWWGGLWADRMTDSAIARQAITEGLATDKELREIAAGMAPLGEAPRRLVRCPPR